MRYLSIAGFLALLLGACTPSPPDLGPPAGWEGTGTRWWKPGVDTSRAFRDLETFEAMNVEQRSITFMANQPLSLHSDMGKQQLIRKVKQSLIRLYRNEPEIVDSLFERIVAPKIEDASLSIEINDEIERFKRTGYKAIQNVFRAPRTTSQLGKDVPVNYPDSLRELGVGGRVRMQLYLNDAGDPQAIALLEGVHPVLDGIAMRATTKMQWSPAYLMRNGNWKPLPSWARFSIRFGTSGS